MFDLAHALQQLERRDEAAQRYGQAVEIAAAFVEVWNKLGVLLAERGDAEEACEAFRRALAVDPAHPMPHYNLADTLSDVGREHDAVRHWKAYLQADSLRERAAYARRHMV